MKPTERSDVPFGNTVKNEDGSFTVYGSAEAKYEAQRKEREERRAEAARKNPIDPDAPLLCEICEEPVEVFDGLDPSSVYPNDGLRHQFGEFDKHGRDLVAHRSCVFKADREASQKKAREAAAARAIIAEWDREDEPERQAWLRLRLHRHEESRSRFGRWLGGRINLEWFVDSYGTELRREIDHTYDELVDEWIRQQSEDLAEVEAQIKKHEEYVELRRNREPNTDVGDAYGELLRKDEKRLRDTVRQFNELNQTSRRTGRP